MGNIQRFINSVTYYFSLISNQNEPAAQTNTINILISISI